MPLFGGGYHGAQWLGDEDLTDIDVHVLGDSSIASAHRMNGIMIVSEKPIDEATQLAIKTMLESAGHGNEVRFIDANAAHGGPHTIKVIEKKVEVTN